MRKAFEENSFCLSLNNLIFLWAKIFFQESFTLWETYFNKESFNIAIFSRLNVTIHVEQISVSCNTSSLYKNSSNSCCTTLAEHFPLNPRSVQFLISFQGEHLSSWPFTTQTALNAFCFQLTVYIRYRITLNNLLGWI